MEPRGSNQILIDALTAERDRLLRRLHRMRDANADDVIEAIQMVREAGIGVDIKTQAGRNKMYELAMQERVFLAELEELYARDHLGDVGEQERVEIEIAEVERQLSLKAGVGVSH